MPLPSVLRSSYRYCCLCLWDAVAIAYVFLILSIRFLFFAAASAAIIHVIRVIHVIQWDAIVDTIAFVCCSIAAVVVALSCVLAFAALHAHCIGLDLSARGQFFPWSMICIFVSWNVDPVRVVFVECIRRSNIGMMSQTQLWWLVLTIFLLGLFTLCHRYDRRWQQEDTCVEVILLCVRFKVK